MDDQDPSDLYKDRAQKTRVHTQLHTQQRGRCRTSTAATMTSGAECWARTQRAHCGKSEVIVMKDHTGHAAASRRPAVTHHQGRGRGPRGYVPLSARSLRGSLGAGKSEPCSMHSGCV